MSEREAAASASLAGLRRRVLSRNAELRGAVAATAAWLITVWPVAASPQVGGALRALAVVALVPGVLAPWWVGVRPRLARHVGLTGFLAVVVATWVWASYLSLMPRLDLYRSVLGAVAWGVFTLSWSHPWSVPDEELHEAPVGITRGLAPRRAPPRFAIALAGLGIVLGLFCLALAWDVQDPDRATWAQALGVGAAVSLTTGGCTVALVAGQRDEARVEGTRLGGAVLRSFLLVVLLAVLVVGAFLTGPR